MAISRVTQSMLTDRSLDPAPGQPLPAGRDPGAPVHRPRAQPPLRQPGRRRVRDAAARRRSAPSSSTPATPRTASAGSTPSTARSAPPTTWCAGPASSACRASAAPRARTTREALAAEVDQIRAALLGAANTTYLDRPVFGGTTAGSVAAFAESGGVVTYTGDTNPVNRTVAEGVVVDVAVAGPAAFGADGDNVFDHLAALAAALRAGDTTGIRAGLDALKADGDRLVVGPGRRRRPRQPGRAGRTIRAADTELSLTNSLSEIENTDLPRAMVDLQDAGGRLPGRPRRDRPGAAAEPAGLSAMIATMETTTCRTADAPRSR